MGKLSRLKPGLTVVKSANITDSLTNSLWPFFMMLGGTWVNWVIAVPLFALAWLVPPALSRFSYAAATDKRAWIKAGLIGAATIFMTVAGLKASNDIAAKIADNREAYFGAVQRSNDILLSPREIEKCHGSTANDCVVRDMVAGVKAEAEAIAKAVPPFSMHEVRLGWGDAVLTGTALTTTLAVITAIVLALIQTFLPYYMAISGQGSVEEILGTKKNAA